MDAGFFVRFSMTSCTLDTVSVACSRLCLCLWISVFFQFWPSDKWTCSQMNSRAKQMSKNLDPEPRADKLWEHAGLLPTCCWPLLTAEVIYVYQECQSTWSLLAPALTAVSEFIIRVEKNNTHQRSVDLFHGAQLHLCGQCLFSVFLLLLGTHL